MPSSLDKHFARFLRERRGDQTYAAFGRRVGLPPSTVFRIEQLQQSATLGRVSQVLKRMKCKMDDVFPPDAPR